MRLRGHLFKSPARRPIARDLGFGFTRRDPPVALSLRLFFVRVAKSSRAAAREIQLSARAAHRGCLSVRALSGRTRAEARLQAHSSGSRPTIRDRAGPPMATAGGYDVFVSHCKHLDASEDRAVWVADVCEGAELKVFFDRSDLTDISAEVLERSVKQSRVLVTVLDPYTFESVWCVRENRWAAAAGRPIVPIYDGDRHRWDTIKKCAACVWLGSRFFTGSRFLPFHVRAGGAAATHTSSRSRPSTTTRTTARNRS